MPSSETMTKEHKIFRTYAWVLYPEVPRHEETFLFQETCCNCSMTTGPIKILMKKYEIEPKDFPGLAADTEDLRWDTNCEDP